MTDTWRAYTARSVLPMFLVVLVYYAQCTYVHVLFTKRYDTAVCCLLPVPFGVLDLVYGVWRLASWRSEWIDARTGSDDEHMGCGGIYCTADFCGSSSAYCGWHVRVVQVSFIKTVFLRYCQAY